MKSRLFDDGPPLYEGGREWRVTLDISHYFLERETVIVRHWWLALMLQDGETVAAAGDQRDTGRATAACPPSPSSSRGTSSLRRSRLGTTARTQPAPPASMALALQTMSTVDNKTRQRLGGVGVGWQNKGETYRFQK